ASIDHRVGEAGLAALAPKIPWSAYFAALDVGPIDAALNVRVPELVPSPARRGRPRRLRPRPAERADLQRQPDRRDEEAAEAEAGHGDEGDDAGEPEEPEERPGHRAAGGEGLEAAEVDDAEGPGAEAPAGERPEQPGVVDEGLDGDALRVGVGADRARDRRQAGADQRDEDRRLEDPDREAGQEGDPRGLAALAEEIADPAHRRDDHRLEEGDGAD